MEQIRHDLSTQHNNSKNLDKPRNKIYRSCLIITHEKYTNVNTSDGVLKKSPDMTTLIAKKCTIHRV